jgi:hypothetical protein
MIVLAAVTAGFVMVVLVAPAFSVKVPETRPLPLPPGGVAQEPSARRKRTVSLVTGGGTTPFKEGVNMSKRAVTCVPV